jgi:hydrogenase expression/formation protein HypC
MCVSMPGQITNIIDSANRIVLVDIMGQSRTINLGLLSEDEGAVGDWVLVHAGLAISRVDPADADSIITMLQAFDQPDQEERP